MFCGYVTARMRFGFQMNFEHLTLLRHPVSRSGNNPGKVKRVVSCKRKTHHLTVTRRKQPAIGKMHDKENEMKCVQDVDLWEFPLQVDNNPETGKTGSQLAAHSSLTEVRNAFPAQTVFLSLVFLCGNVNHTMCFSSQGTTAQ